jgi:hypothetical protein
MMIHLYVQEKLSKLILPGPVEIDEACIYKLRRGDHGRLARIVYWVFSLKCRTTKQVIIYPACFIFDEGRAECQCEPFWKLEYCKH